VLTGPGSGGGDLQGGNHRHQDDGTQTHHGRPAQQVRHTFWGALQDAKICFNIQTFLTLQDAMMCEIYNKW